VAAAVDQVLAPAPWGDQVALVGSGQVAAAVVLELPKADRVEKAVRERSSSSVHLTVRILVRHRRLILRVIPCLND
jgi:hypothetical protein